MEASSSLHLAASSPPGVQGHQTTVEAKEQVEQKDISFSFTCFLPLTFPTLISCFSEPSKMR